MFEKYQGTLYRASASPDLVRYAEIGELHAMDFMEAVDFYTQIAEVGAIGDIAYLGAVDRYFLLTNILARTDAFHPWLYDRCREVEGDPDGHLDLWARYHYKAECLETPTITPLGWRPFGDLKVGDEVFGPDGKPTRIVAQTPIFTDADCYRVTFDKGESIVCSGDHLWTVDIANRARVSGNKRAGRARVTIDTRTLMKKVDHARLIKGAVWPSVPVAAALDFGASSSPLPLHPYVLGAWLGDGARGAAAIANDPFDNAIIERIEALGHRTRRRRGRGIAVGIYGLAALLREAGTFTNKHIPGPYQCASIEDRWELLRGLMDTDGHCDGRGTATFCNATERLANDVFDLAAGLGLKPSIRRPVGQYKGDDYPYYQVSFQVQADGPAVFHLPRKQARASNAKRTRSGRHAIISVEPVASVPVRCIQVARTDGLYLTGRQHITTHNSTIITLAGCVQEIINDPEITIGIFAHTAAIAKKFVAQIRREFETSEMRMIYPDICWMKPKGEAPIWSEQAFTIRRKGNPKEATVEGWGVVDGQPTSKHFALRNYDDMVTRESVTTPEQVAKTTSSYELSTNLGTAEGREWMVGTRYCTRGDQRILMGDWSHKPIADVRIGDTVVGWELRDGKRWLRPAKVVNRGVHFCQAVNRYHLDNGRSVVCTDDHKWWRGPHGGGPEYAPLGLSAHVRKDRAFLNKKCDGRLIALRELVDPIEEDQGRDAGWLAGFFDGEGSIKKNKHHPSGAVTITQTMAHPELINETRRVLSELGFEWSEAWHKPSAKHWNDRCVFLINGGWRERYRFLAQIAPARFEKLAQTLYGQLTTRRIKLSKVEAAGVADVHWLETETGNYVVEGFCSSNSFADTYGDLIGRGIVKPRLYPATHNGKLDGKPVMMTQAQWDKAKVKQLSTVNAQMLQNPLGGTAKTFHAEWMKPWFVRPAALNVYILADPSRGRTAKSDNTAIAVIGVDAQGNKYFLDGARHRMKLSQRWDQLKHYHKKWSKMPGVMLVKVGYERFGQQSDDEYFQERMRAEKYNFAIHELAWPREGGNSKRDRVERLQPDVQYSTFFFPGLVYANGKTCLWEPDIEKGYMSFTPLDGELKVQKMAKDRGQEYLNAKPLMRKDELDKVYDLTRALMEEMLYFPFGTRDDLVDATSRIYDIEALPASTNDEVPETPATVD
jgi:hypothetical protein